MTFQPVTHVIFDVDGLLLDTEKSYFKVNRELCAEYGKEYTMELAKKILGTTEQDTANVILQETNIPLSADEYLKEKDRMGLSYMENSELMPGAEKLIRHLHKSGIPIAIATSACVEMLEVKIEKNHKEIFGLFDHLVSASSDPAVKNGKPEPDIFLICAERFKDSPAPSKCLVFEDSPNGVVGALKAGMQVVMVPEEYIDEDNKKNATLVLNSLLDFKPEWFGLPSYEK